MEQQQRRGGPEALGLVHQGVQSLAQVAVAAGVVVLDEVAQASPALGFSPVADDPTSVVVEAPTEGEPLLDATAWVAQQETNSDYALPTTTSSDYTYQHDLLDRLTTVTHKNGDQRTVAYDRKNVTVIDGEENSTTYAMSAHGQVVRKSQPTDEGDIHHDYNYDAEGRLTLAEGPECGRFFYAYYLDGAVGLAWTPAGVTLYFRTPGGKLGNRRDPFHRLSQRSPARAFLRRRGC